MKGRDNTNDSGYAYETSSLWNDEMMKFGLGHYSVLSQALVAENVRPATGFI